MYRQTQRYFPKPQRKVKTFDPSVFVKKAEVQPEETYINKHAFSDFPIRQELKIIISRRGYQTPTPIQDQAIIPILEGKDVVGIANTGTGKTAAFLIPLINKVLLDRTQKVLIITPTRELALQIVDEFRQFAQHLSLYSVLCIGGINIRPQIRMLQSRHNFVIGTPGRLKDLENRRNLNLGEYRSIVLDEVDRMLDMGFIHDIKYLISKLPRTRHSLFFSATLPDSVKDVMQSFLINPVMILLKARETSANVDQDIINTRGKEKIEVLHDLLIQKGFDKVLVFGRTKWGIKKLARKLVDRGFAVAEIHGNKSQNQRQKAIASFKENAVQVLLATDIASRGLDIPNVTHVINYDLPESYEDYIHRIGRTGRLDNKGTALTFID